MRKNQGFTLIDVVMSLFFISVCMLIVVNIFIGQNQIYKSITAELNINNDARTSLDDLGAYVRQANRTLSTYSSYTASAQVLILQIQAIDSTDQMIPAVFDNVVYYMNGTDLFRQVFPNASSSREAVTKKVAGNVNSINFTYNNADYAQVTEVSFALTLQESAGIYSRTITVSSKARLRDY